MNDKCLLRFYLASIALVTAVSLYPVCMGIHVAGEVLRYGAVPMDNYPKYIIPYTPISIAVILGVLLIPVLHKISEKRNFLWGAVVSTGIFFVAEILMESKILVQAEELVRLESWQMGMCYVPPEQYQTRPWKAVDVLLGGYSPAFKIHFYIISVVIILSLLNCFYGFYHMVRLRDYTKKRVLTIQAVTGISFLGMCIWACFTSFYRTGELTVSAISSSLMIAFFVLLGVTVGTFASSFTLGKNWKLSVLLPAALSAATVLAMYIGEMILLSGNLYRFGTGVLFDAVGALVLAPADLLAILVSGSITALVSRLANVRPTY